MAAITNFFCESGVPVLCLDINSASAARVTSSFRKNGLHLYLGGCDTVHRTAVLANCVGRPCSLPQVNAQDRYAAVVFEFATAHCLRKLLVIATYGHAADNLATAHVAHATGLNWVTLGGYDYNITQEESPMARTLLALPCRCLDDAFLCQGPLPPTSAGPGAGESTMDWPLRTSSPRLCPRSGGPRAG